MSREIKFRAWDIEAKKMRHIIMGLRYALHGLIACEWCDSATLDNHWLRNDADCVGGKDGFILMQYTECKDKNGVEIYEGDIIEYFQFSRVCSKCAHRDKNVDKVKFNSLGATLSSYRIIDPENDITELKVIGNVHENGELLEDKT